MRLKENGIKTKTEIDIPWKPDLDNKNNSGKNILKLN